MGGSKDHLNLEAEKMWKYSDEPLRLVMAKGKPTLSAEFQCRMLLIMANRIPRAKRIQDLLQKSLLRDVEFKTPEINT